MSAKERGGSSGSGTLTNKLRTRLPERLPSDPQQRDTKDIRSRQCYWARHRPCYCAVCTSEPAKEQCVHMWVKVCKTILLWFERERNKGKSFTLISRIYGCTKYIHSYIHTYIYTYIHAYIHTYQLLVVLESENKLARLESLSRCHDGATHGTTGFVWGIRIKGLLCCTAKTEALDLGRRNDDRWEQEKINQERWGEERVQFLCDMTCHLGYEIMHWLATK